MQLHTHHSSHAKKKSIARGPLSPLLPHQQASFERGDVTAPRHQSQRAWVAWPSASSPPLYISISSLSSLLYTTLLFFFSSFLSYPSFQTSIITAPITTMFTQEQPRLRNWIDGEFTDPVSAATDSSSTTTPYLPVASPYNGKVIGHVPISTAQDVERAVKAAHAAFPAWSSRTIKDRAAILLRFHALLTKHADPLADMVVLEHGKNKAEALASVLKGQETVEYALSLPQVVQGKMLEVSRGITCSDTRVRTLSSFPRNMADNLNRRAAINSILVSHQSFFCLATWCLLAHGVVASVVPFNFPVMVPMWTLPIAIAMGKVKGDLFGDQG